MNACSSESEYIDKQNDRVKCFVIQPFGKRILPGSDLMVDNDRVYAALTKMEKDFPDFPILIYRGDTTNVRKEDLHTHVNECILESHFCIADFTGQNPNVIYETGFARGVGREVIVLCQSRSNVPTDLTGIITVVYKMAELDYLSHDIGQHLDRIKKSLAKVRKESHAMVPYFSTRNDNLIRRKIQDARAKIEILSTNMSYVKNTVLDDLDSALKVNDELELRILTLNPQSIFVNFRGEQVGHKREIGSYRLELQNSLSVVYFRLRNYENRVRIKLYDDLPTQIVFFFDSEILACVVSAIGRSRHNCAFLLSDKLPGASKSFIEHFNYLWEKNSIPLDELTDLISELSLP